MAIVAMFLIHVRNGVQVVASPAMTATSAATTKAPAAIHATGDGAMSSSGTGVCPKQVSVAAKMVPNLILAEDPYELATGADALIVVTEWNEFKNLDLERIRTLLKQPILLDGRNIYNPEDMVSLGYTYLGIGRSFEAHD